MARVLRRNSRAVCASAAAVVKIFIAVPIAAALSNSPSHIYRSCCSPSLHNTCPSFLCRIAPPKNYTTIPIRARAKISAQEFLFSASGEPVMTASRGSRAQKMAGSRWHPGARATSNMCDFSSRLHFAANPVPWIIMPIVYQLPAELSTPCFYVGEDRIRPQRGQDFSSASLPGSSSPAHSHIYTLGNSELRRGEIYAAGEEKRQKPFNLPGSAPDSVCPRPGQLCPRPRINPAVIRGQPPRSPRGRPTPPQAATCAALPPRGATAAPIAHCPPRAGLVPRSGRQEPARPRKSSNRARVGGP